MHNFGTAIRILTKATTPRRKATTSVTHLFYEQLLLTSLFLFAFGFGVLFAFRVFGLAAFPVYLAISWLLFGFTIPKALTFLFSEQLAVAYASLPISQMAWKFALLTHFGFRYGSTLFIPLVCFSIWALIQQSATIFLAGIGLWLLVLTSLGLIQHYSSGKIRSRLALLGKISLIIATIFTSLGLLQPAQFTFFQPLQTWLTPPFWFSHLVCFSLGLGGFSWFFKQAPLMQLTLQTHRQGPHELPILWFWLKKPSLPKGFWGQWLSNLGFLFIVALLTLPQLLPNVTPFSQQLIVTAILFGLGTLFSPAWCLFSLMAAELPLLRTLPFHWARDYARKWLVVWLLQLALSIIFGLCLVGLLPNHYAFTAFLSTFIELCFLFTGSIYLALTFDLRAPFTTWHSVVQLLRPTFKRTLVTLGLVCLWLALTLLLRPLMPFTASLCASIFTMLSCQSYAFFWRQKNGYQ